MLGRCCTQESDEPSPLFFTLSDTMEEVSSDSQEPLRSDGSIFGNNNFIQGGTFVLKNSKTVTGNSTRKGFELLQQRVATSAFHNSAQRVDPPRCHPNTRDAILQQIFDWVIGSRDRHAWLMWLNGAAGAGKSAIAQSIAERLVAEGIPVANFFFSRLDNTRNTMASLVATLVYHIIQAVPTSLDDIIQAIEQNPLIFEQSLETQFEILIIQPLLRIHALGRLIIIIDGLDECANVDMQRSLIKALGSLMNNRRTPLVFLVCSRAEPHLQMVFEQLDITKTLVRLPLDDVTKTSDGIRVYLNDKFAEIKQFHPFRSTLPKDWPKSSVIEGIIAKSSGQFIYASVVMNYISFPTGHPAVQLDVVNGIRLRPSSENPFSNLDALYHHIFSKVKFLSMTLDILAYVLLSQQRNIPAIEWAFGLTTGEVEVFLADLTSVISCKPKSDDQLTPEQQNQRAVRFLHASLSDFLFDASRSAVYYIDSKEYSTKLACMLLARPFPPIHLLGQPNPYLHEPLLSFLQSAKGSKQLYEGLSEFVIHFQAREVYDPLKSPTTLVKRRRKLKSHIKPIEDKTNPPSPFSLSYLLDLLYALRNLAS